MNQIQLSAGTIEYQDSGGDGPAIVLLHGMLMDASLWDAVIADLSADHRCVAPTLPLGAHRHGMHADADLTLPGIARLVAEFLDRLDLHDVTLVGNDTGGALVQLLIADGTARVGQVVLASCDAFDNFPPGLTGRTLVLTGKLSPAMFGLFMQQMRLRPLRRLPIAFGWLTKRGDAATARWLKPVLKQREIRRDTVRVLRAVAADAEPPARCRHTPTQLRPPRPRRLGKPGPRDATRPRPAPRRTPPTRTPGRDSRQLHAHPPRPARGVRSAHPGVHPRIRQNRLSLPRRAAVGHVAQSSRSCVMSVRSVIGPRRADLSGLAQWCRYRREYRPSERATRWRERATRWRERRTPFWPHARSREPIARRKAHLAGRSWFTGRAESAKLSYPADRLPV